jgi:hypothetical protein
MAKPVVLSFGGITSSFDAVKVDRSKLYGSRKRIAVDAKDRQCVKAALTADGSQLIRSGMTAQGYFSEDGSPIARTEMVGLDPAGNVVEVKPSTLGVEQALSGPVSASEVLDLELESVFWLEPIEVTENLMASLKEGAIYMCAFNYTAGLEVETAFLLSNSEGIFAIVGKPVEPQWVEEGTVFLAEVTEDEEDELDFESL